MLTSMENGQFIASSNYTHVIPIDTKRRPDVPEMHSEQFDAKGQLQELN